MTPEKFQMFENRLLKNFKHRLKQAKRLNVTCWRLYDHDLPEFPICIEFYEDFIYIAEYNRRHTLTDEEHTSWFNETKKIIADMTGVPIEKMYVKLRKRMSHREGQYEKEEVTESKIITVQENGHKFLVNLTDYLDTGLFLDHRPVRALLAEMTAGKTLLNLFCYTASATVQAALAGAKSSLSVDMSNTYLDWAQRNFELNSLSSSRHQLLRADCLKWLEEDSQTFDVIFLDPPTFSNSKKMESVLDVQRDHPELIRQAMAKLNPEGTLVFSNNFRKFKLDELTSRQFNCENITQQTLDTDFERNPRIHNVWLITKRSSFG